MKLHLKPEALQALHDNLGNRPEELLTNQANDKIRILISKEQTTAVKGVHRLAEKLTMESLGAASRRHLVDSTRTSMKAAAWGFEATGDTASLVAASELWNLRKGKEGNDEGAAIFADRLTKKPAAEVAAAIEKYCDNKDVMGAYQTLAAFMNISSDDTTPLYVPCQRLIAVIVEKGFRKMPLQQAKILLELHRSLSDDVPTKAAEYAAMAKQAGASDTVQSFLKNPIVPMQEVLVADEVLAPGHPTVHVEAVPAGSANGTPAPIDVHAEIAAAFASDPAVAEKNGDEVETV